MTAAIARANVRKDAAPARLRRTLTFKPSSLDEETRSVEAVAATSGQVSMGGFDQVLSFAPGAIDTRRLDAGMPVLDSHNRFSLKGIIGRVAGYRIDSGRLIVAMEFADTADGRNAFDLTRQGMISKVSIGYRVLEAQDRETAGRRPLEIVTRWEPYEVSLVVVPADINATIRSTPKMAKMATKRRIRASAPADLDEEGEIIGRDIDHDDEHDERGEARGQTRRDGETRAERRRISILRDIAERAKIDEDELNRAIDDGDNPDEFRTRAFDIMAERDRRTMTSSFHDMGLRDQGADRAGFVADALAHRMAPTHIQLTAGNPYAGLRIPDMARQYLADSGERVRGLSDSDIIARALDGRGGESRGMHTASDFPALLQGAGERALLARFNALPSPLKVLSDERSARDFRSQSIIRPGEAPRLEKLTEHGEIKSGTMAEEASAYQVETYAKKFALTRKALVNDDLGAFTDFMNAFAVSARGTEGDLFYALLSANSFAGKTLGDGTALFHANRGNLAASGAALSVTTLGAARQAMRLQKDVNKTGRAGVVPKYLLVGPALETVAEQLIASINAATVEDVNPFGGKLSLLVEDRYEGNGWWLFADPANEPAFVHGYLDGRNGPQVETRNGWDILGLEFRCVLDFGCGVREWRAAYRNPGA